MKSSASELSLSDNLAQLRKLIRPSDFINLLNFSIETNFAYIHLTTVPGAMASGIFPPTCRTSLERNELKESQEKYARANP